MIRMEIACFFVIAFMAVIYFSAKRERTKIHNTFSAILIVSMIHLILDGATVYTVNHLYSIPLWLNDILHRLFIGTMLVVFYFLYRYIALLIEDEVEKNIHISRCNTYILVAAQLVIALSPIYYQETEQGNYSYGPVPYTAYLGIAVYLAMVVVLLYRFWGRIHYRKKLVICMVMSIEILISVYQAFHPLALMSGMGIMLINMSFYLLMENPDIVLVKQVQEEKRKAEEANAAKSVFLSQMSHEIRTPMNAIVGMAEILLRTDLSEEQREYLNNIKSSGNALVSMINDLLDVSKIEAGKMELVEDVYEMRPMLDNIRMMIQNRIGDKPIQLLFEIDRELPDRLYGDGLRIRQVLINLLNNAVKFTEAGQIKLLIKITRKTGDEAELFVSVSDTGQGIRKEDLNRLFGAFEQVDAKRNAGKEGTGLGLTICSQLIRLMGGKLEVKSEYEVGSDFFFTISQKIPTKDAAAEGALSDAEGEAMDFVAPDAKILIVDDNEMNRKVAVGLLAPLGMQIDLADSGKRALAMVQQKHYHIVFMDHMMPVMDGVEAVRRLREMEDDYYREVPVIALTANAMKEAKKLFAEAGMNDVLTKPIDMRQMCRVLKKWLPQELLIRQAKPRAASANATVVVNGTNIPGGETFIEGIDVQEGIRNCGREELFMGLLGDFYQLIDAKSLKIEKCVEDQLIREYTVEVHALKSTSRMIGAMGLSEQFAALEQYGNESNIEAIRTETPKVLLCYRKYKEILEPYGRRQQTAKREASGEEVIGYLQAMKDAVEGFDIDGADRAMEQLEECRLPEGCLPLMEQLRVFVADVAMEEMIQTAEEMITMIEQNH